MDMFFLCTVASKALKVCMHKDKTTLKAFKSAFVGIAPKKTKQKKSAFE